MNKGPAEYSVIRKNFSASVEAKKSAGGNSGRESLHIKRINTVIVVC